MCVEYNFDMSLTVPNEGPAHNNAMTVPNGGPDMSVAFELSMTVPNCGPGMSSSSPLVT